MPILSRYAKDKGNDISLTLGFVWIRLRIDKGACKVAKDKEYREKQKASKQAKILELQQEMRQAYRQKNPKLADEIMEQIRELRG